ncbi:MAG: hypothetical protein ABJA93_10345 [Sporichthyaceae bacterium]
MRSRTGPDGKPVKFGLTWSQRRAFALSVLGFQVLVWGDVLLNDGRYGGSWKTALVGVGLLGMAAATWWIGTSATRRGLVIHALPSMIIPWDDVHEIEVELSLGISTVVVHHGKSRRTRLSAPTTGPLGRDEHFQEKVRVLRTFWAANRTSATAA